MKNRAIKVIGKIINDAGETVAMRNFGEMMEDEFRKVLKVLQQEYPG